MSPSSSIAFPPVSVERSSAGSSSPHLAQEIQAKDVRAIRDVAPGIKQAIVKGEESELAGQRPLAQGAGFIVWLIAILTPCRRTGQVDAVRHCALEQDKRQTSERNAREVNSSEALPFSAPACISDAKTTEPSTGAGNFFHGPVAASNRPCQSVRRFGQWKFRPDPAGGFGCRTRLTGLLADIEWT